MLQYFCLKPATDQESLQGEDFSFTLLLSTVRLLEEGLQRDLVHQAAWPSRRRSLGLKGNQKKKKAKGTIWWSRR